MQNRWLDLIRTCKSCGSAVSLWNRLWLCWLGEYIPFTNDFTESYKVLLLQTLLYLWPFRPGSTDFPKHIPNTSDAMAPLRLFASLRCCGHSQRASAWWSDHWGNACIASWDAAFNKLCLPPKIWETKTHTLRSSTLQVEPVTLRCVDCNHSNDE